MNRKLEICLECGQVLRQLTPSHLQRHAMTLQDYEEKYGGHAYRPMAPLPGVKRVHVDLNTLAKLRETVAGVS